MENSSDEDMNSDNEYIDLKSLLTGSPFLSDSSSDEGKRENENVTPSEDGYTPVVIELFPISATANELSSEMDESATDRLNGQSIPATLDVTPPNQAQINTSTPTPERRRLTRIAPHEYKLPFDDDLEQNEATRINQLRSDTSLISPIPSVVYSPIAEAINFSNSQNMLNFSSLGFPSVAQSTPMRRGRAIRGKSFRGNTHLGQSRRALNFSVEQENQSLDGDEWVLRSSRQLGNTSMNTSIDAPVGKCVPRWKLKQMAESSNTSDDKTDPDVDSRNDSRFVLPAVLKQKEMEAEISEATRAERVEYVFQLMCNTMPARRPRRAPKKPPTKESESSADSKEDKK